MILGTAGHIDHGKTTLVRALTGVDTDQLPEEKRRGITIDLGFAALHYAGRETVGVVDVPGHEAFVRTMLAGASGIDLALLVVAADEGVMPQTREHLSILTLLGVSHGVIALTKSDRVDGEWLDLVRQDVREATVATPLEGAPIIAASGTTGEGIDLLRDAIGAAAARLSPRSTCDLFRMPVDRVFTVRGTGTVVTGTVWSGTLAPDDRVRILPGTRVARVRAVQVHGETVDRVAPGTRAAISLHGVAVEELSRGDVVVADDAWRSTRVLRAEVRLLEGRPVALSHRTMVRFHLGTQDVGARIVASGGLASGPWQGARVVLDAPVVARAGDRFVIRAGAPLGTIGGGVITDPVPEGRRVRPWAGGAVEPAERLARFVTEAGNAGLEQSILPVRLGVPPSTAAELVASAPGTIAAGSRLYAEPVVAALADRLAAVVRTYHANHPLDPGMPLQAARASLNVPSDLCDAVVHRAMVQNRLRLSGATLAACDWAAVLTPQQAALSSRLQAALDEAGWEPPTVRELEVAFGEGLEGLLRKLEREGALVQIESGRFAARAALDALATSLREAMSPGTCHPPSEIRNMLGVSRKYLIPLLEYCDRVGLTERRNDGRVLRGT